ncbi:Thioredoxin-like superfamily [Sesbania bispinosa]|nr:Thioredoxin-like superfamily [Sesbania bispinosa]
MAEEVKLLGTWANPFSCGVELALKLKGVEYEFIEEILDNKSPLLLGYNPDYKNKVPVLVHNGKPIAGFLFILDYVDETWDHHPLLPSDPYGRAKSRFWAKSIYEKLFSIGAKALFGKGTRMEDGKIAFDEFVKLLENELEGKDFFGGDTIGYLDIAAIIIPILFGRVQEVLGMELVSQDKFPNIFKWIEKLNKIDVFNQTYPPKDVHMVYIRARHEANQASK